MKTLWFKAKRYGWGWTPSTWQGWLSLAIYIALEFGDFSLIDARSHSVSDTLITFIPDTIILTGFFILLCYKTGEKPGWRWGNK